MFHRECGKDSARYQWTGCAVVPDEFFQNFSMKWPRMQRNDAGVPQPLRIKARIVTHGRPTISPLLRSLPSHCANVLCCGASALKA